MILNDKVKININSNNIKYFKNKGFQNINVKDIINVEIKDISKGSNVLIDCKCDICGKQKKIKYRFYLENYEKYNIYTCHLCSKIKNKLTCKNKYNDENYNNREKFIKTLKDNNWDNKKIGILEKVVKTNLKKYGVENVSQLEEIKNKRKDTMLKNHGVEYYVLSKEFREKSEKTSLKNYGTKHPQTSEKMLMKRKEYYKKMGFNILNQEYDLYKRNVYKLTKKVKKELIEEWNGKDYYDGEYIKNNFKLPYYDGNYPTIDHKISIFEGYKNNISPIIISDISNLCLTKRKINSKKYIKIEYDFKLLF